MLGFSRNGRKRPRTRRGERIYAIGDVHGRHDLLRELLRRIVEHWEKSDPPKRNVKLVFLGDIIDRGPASDRCLKLVQRLIRGGGVELLRGNHEDMLIEAAAANPAAVQAWLANGGDATLASFGIDPPLPGEDSFDFAERLIAGIPPAVLDMLRAAPAFTTSGDYFFVHAGVRPGVPLDRQVVEDLYSIRQDFTASERWHGAVIVHGHSIVDEIEIRHNRISCDTGAYRTGLLSCLCLQDEQQEIITT